MQTMVSPIIIRLTSISKLSRKTRIILIPMNICLQPSRCRSAGRYEMTWQGKPGKAVWMNLLTSGRNVNAIYIFIRVLCWFACFRSILNVTYLWASGWQDNFSSSSWKLCASRWRIGWMVACIGTKIEGVKSVFSEVFQLRKKFLSFAGKFTDSLCIFRIDLMAVARKTVDICSWC